MLCIYSLGTALLRERAEYPQFQVLIFSKNDHKTGISRSPSNCNSIDKNLVSSAMGGTKYFTSTLPVYLMSNKDDIVNIGFDWIIKHLQTVLAVKYMYTLYNYIYVYIYIYTCNCRERTCNALH